MLNYIFVSYMYMYMYIHVQVHVHVGESNEHVYIYNEGNVSFYFLPIMHGVPNILTLYSML